MTKLNEFFLKKVSSESSMHILCFLCGDIYKTKCIYSLSIIFKELAKYGDLFNIAIEYFQGSITFNNSFILNSCRCKHCYLNSLKNNNIKSPIYLFNYFFNYSEIYSLLGRTSSKQFILSLIEKNYFININTNKIDIDIITKICIESYIYENYKLYYWLSKKYNIIYYQDQLHEMSVCAAERGNFNIFLSNIKQFSTIYIRNKEHLLYIYKYALIHKNLKIIQIIHESLCINFIYDNQYLKISNSFRYFHIDTDNFFLPKINEILVSNESFEILEWYINNLNIPKDIINFKAIIDYSFELNKISIIKWFLNLNINFSFTLDKIYVVNEITEYKSIDILKILCCKSNKLKTSEEIYLFILDKGLELSPWIMKYILEKGYLKVLKHDEYFKNFFNCKYIIKFNEYNINKVIGYSIVYGHSNILKWILNETNYDILNFSICSYSLHEFNSEILSIYIRNNIDIKKRSIINIFIDVFSRLRIILKLDILHYIILISEKLSIFNDFSLYSLYMYAIKHNNIPVIEYLSNNYREYIFIPSTIDTNNNIFLDNSVSDFKYLYENALSNKHMNIVKWFNNNHPFYLSGISYSLLTISDEYLDILISLYYNDNYLIDIEDVICDAFKHEQLKIVEWFMNNANIEWNINLLKKINNDNINLKIFRWIYEKNYELDIIYVNENIERIFKYKLSCYCRCFKTNVIKCINSEIYEEYYDFKQWFNNFNK